MKIKVINPNTTSMTEKIGVAAQSVANPGTELLALDRGYLQPVN